MYADTIFTGGRVHLGRSGVPDAEALAVAGGRIVAVGSAYDIADLRGPATDVVELAGGMLLPGFQDAHAHPLHGGLATLRCDLYRHSTLDGYREEIAAYAARHPDAEWIVGGGWSMDDFGGAMPTRHLLDEIAPGRAVCLETRDGHTSWLSTRALELAGIGPDTPVPKGGVVDREPDDTPAGTVHELADWLEANVLPPPTPGEWDEALLRAQAELHRLGITACQEANATEELVDTYLRASTGGRLTLRVEGNLEWSRHRGDDQIAELVERRAIAVGPRLRMRGAKLFQDGVVENGTAAMLDAYRDATGQVTGSRGESLYEPRDLDRIVALLDREGFQVHVHTLGDRAVREALDALEGARRSNGARDARHHLAHVQFVHPDDLPRFAALDVAANVTPLWAVRSGYVEDLTLPFVSPEAARLMYPFGSLQRAGARLVVGSDWPVSSPDPLLQLEVAVRRRLPGSDDEPFLPDERLDLRAAISAATLGAAFVNGLDDRTGTLEVGKLADLVVLDRDLLGSDAPAPTAATVRLTLVEGAIVYDGR